VADDDPDNARLVEESVRAEGHLVRACPDGEAALHLMRSWSPDVMLLDINMPKLNGLECLKKVREQSKGSYTGVILVTANSQLDQIILGLDLGADDYITKPYRVDELRARLRGCLRVKALHDALRLTNRRLEEAATFDELTGLRNMRYMAKRLATEVDECLAAKKNLSCMMLDMDHFKMVNDKHDHLFGSYVLSEVGAILRSLLRPTDVAARYGGDEFFVLLPNTSLREAVEIADQLRRAIAAHLFKSGNHATHITSSFGVCGSSSGTEFPKIEAREFIRSADGALYAAKNGGRNRVETAAPGH
jgi:two-component system cell cycle response regulator